MMESIEKEDDTMPKMNLDLSRSQIDFTVDDKSMLGKEENLLEPVNSEKNDKPCSSVEASLTEFTAEEEKGKRGRRKKRKIFKLRRRLKVKRFLTSNWVEAFMNFNLHGVFSVDQSIPKEQPVENEFTDEKKGKRTQTDTPDSHRYKSRRRRNIEDFLPPNWIEVFRNFEQHGVLSVDQSIPREQPVNDEFPDLTADMEERIECALGIELKTYVLSTFKDCRCTRADLEKLTGRRWLNDRIINFYLALIKERSRNHPEYPQVHCYDSCFFPALRLKGPENALKFTKRIEDQKNIFQFDLLFVPLHFGNHWALCVIDNRTKKMKYYDSMSVPVDDSVIMMQIYLAAEKKYKLDLAMDPNEYSIEMVKDIPLQKNSSDCGMFILKYAEYLSRDAFMTFSQENMPYFRRRMMIEILDMKLL